MVTSRDMTLAPPFRGGAIAVFPATRERRASGRLVSETGAPALAGRQALEAIVSFAGPSTVQTWLGGDGEFYVEGLEPGHYVIDVEAPALRCRAEVDVPTSDAPITRLGDLRCTGVSP
jgi:hypothetical protein